MKVIKLLVFLCVCCPVRINAQLSVDMAFGSQSTFPSNIDRAKFQYFSVAPAIRYMGERLYIKFGFRKGFNSSYEMRGQTLMPNSSGGGGYYVNQKIGVNMHESGFGVGVGLTVAPTSSKTRPYLMFEYYKMSSELAFDSSPVGVTLNSNIGNSDGDVSGRTFTLELNQVRFGVGIQFQISSDFVFFNEAIIGLNNGYNLYLSLFTIDLGLRYYLPFKSNTGSDGSIFKK